MRHLVGPVVLLFSCWPLAARETLPLAERLAMSAGTRIESLEVSPDGSSLLAVVQMRDSSYADSFIYVRDRALFIVDLETGRKRRIASECADVRVPAWSPDGTNIAYFAKCGDAFGVAIQTSADETLNRWIELKGEAANPIGEVAGLVWSDDGASLAFVHDPQTTWSESFIGRASSSVDSLPSPIVMDSSTSRTPLMSSQGFTGTFFGDAKKRVVIADTSGSVRALSWQPEGSVRLLRLRRDRLLLATGGEVIAVPLHGESEPTIIAKDVVQANARFVVETRARRLSIRRLDGEKPSMREVSKPPELRITGLTAGGELLTLRESGMSSELFLVRSGGDAPELVLGGDVVVRRTLSSRGGLTAFVVTSASVPEELWIWREGSAPQRLTSWAEPVGLNVRTERVLWKSDGVELEGLLVTPEHQRKNLPTLLFLHGGPEDRVRFDFHYLASFPKGGAALEFASRGWAVFLPNFRGSDGYGEESRRALRDGHYLDVPAADSLAGLDALVARGLADPDRLAVAGFSYGGTLTAWLIARDHRFRAAAAMAGILDLLQDDRSRLRGTRALHALGGMRSGPEDNLLDAWNAPEKYQELSPLESAVRIRTPTLLLSTAMEQLAGTGHASFFNGASLNGNPVRWLHYPSAWHGGSWSPEMRIDAVTRVISWLERWTVQSESNEGQAPVSD